jgi:hypothetical protein
VPFETELAVFNSISDRVEQRARIRIANVRVDADGAVRRDDGDDATSGEKKRIRRRDVLRVLRVLRVRR